MTPLNYEKLLCNERPLRRVSFVIAGNPPQKYNKYPLSSILHENMQSCRVKKEKEYKVWFHYSISWNCSIIQETAPFSVG
jgi:hypothetical protein